MGQVERQQREPVVEDDDPVQRRGADAHLDVRGGGEHQLLQDAGQRGQPGPDQYLTSAAARLELGCGVGAGQRGAHELGGAGEAVDARAHRLLVGQVLDPARLVCELIQRHVISPRRCLVRSSLPGGANTTLFTRDVYWPPGRNPRVFPGRPELAWRAALGAVSPVCVAVSSRWTGV
ncbi:hypothetical protein ACFQ0O_01970 [Saccharopolyspora spinosporotrichia]